MEDTTLLQEQIVDESSRFQLLKQEVGQIIVGNEYSIDFIIIALLCEGHVLLEGLPGVAKTTMIKAIAQTLGLTCQRIQFTPDLLPADLIGTLVYNPKTHDFETRKGPIFANLVLADEINRTPAKVQAALLEAMQEQQVTIGNQTFKLDRPFLVLATQNPIEQEGTYRLPEAQVDRFIFKLIITYPTKQQEKQILHAQTDISKLRSILSKADITRAQELMRQIYVDDKVVDYIISIVFATRDPESYNLKKIKDYILYGVSPRATRALYETSKAYAFLKKRHFVTPDDVKAVAPAVLRHRITLSYQAEADEILPDTIIKTILNSLPTP
jgi:MoxR-like ATPase